MVMCTSACPARLVDLDKDSAAQHSECPLKESQGICKSVLTDLADDGAYKVDSPTETLVFQLEYKEGLTYRDMRALEVPLAVTSVSLSRCVTKENVALPGHTFLAPFGCRFSGK